MSILIEKLKAKGKSKTLKKKIAVLLSAVMSVMAFTVNSFAVDSADATSGVKTVVTLVGDVFTMITGNPILMVFLGASLLGAAIAIFRKIKGASR